MELLQFRTRFLYIPSSTGTRSLLGPTGGILCSCDSQLVMDISYTVPVVPTI